MYSYTMQNCLESLW